MVRTLSKNTPVRFSELEDEELVQLIVSDGIVEAYGTLYDRYSQRVFNKCLSFAKSVSVAEDMTHNIFVKAFVSLSTFKHRSKFSTWFYSLTYHMCVDHARKQQSSKKVNYIEVDEIERRRIKVIHCDAEENLLALKVEELKLVLEKLHPEDRVILMMKYQDEMTIKEIQQQFKISQSSVKMRLVRARERAVAIHQKLFPTREHEDEF